KISYAYTHCKYDIVVRLTLDALQFDVLKLMVRQGMGLVLVGVALALAGALATTRLMTTLLFDVSARHPVTFAVVPAVLTIVAFVACYIPARRATKVDPLVALRYE